MLKKIFWIAILILIGAAVYFSGADLLFKKADEKADIQEAKDAYSKEDAKKDYGPEARTEEKKKLPAKVLLEVPFTAQAPFAEWDALHEEACEEASIIMVKYFLEKKKLTPETAEQEIQKMVEFEKKNYGHFEDSDAREIVRLAEDFYGIKNLKVVYDFSKEDMKKYLAAGRPIIVPVAGRLLGNPNFTQPGPLYHALVLVGYKGNDFIANDPGTRKGKGYAYDADVLYNAIHDFPGRKEDIETGKKAMIVVE